jgi:nucleoside-diphosphate-sugar epimerase
MDIATDARIFVAGQRGLVGSAICRLLKQRGYTNLLSATSDELDLRDQTAVHTWFEESRPEYVYLVAGKVGGIQANMSFPAEFLYDNLMMRKFHDARLQGQPAVEVWGSGTPLREFLHVDDLASACVFLMEHYSDAELVNIGTGVDLSIRELAETMRDVVYPAAALTFDASRPDGTPRKLLDVGRLTSLGWQSTISLREGIEQTYSWLLDNQDNLRGKTQPTPS